MTLNPIPTSVVVIVMLCWFVFGGILLFRKKPSQAKERKRERSFAVGSILQGLGYALVWSLQRPRFSTIVGMSLLPELVLAALTIGIAAGSVWLVMSAIQTLGKQWSFAARIVEEHTLITEGPYKFVRHPIYAGMFGMMLATGLAISHWVALIPAVLIFWLGTRLRIASEEKLLRETFGDQYMQYALRVPALIPRLLPRSAQKSAG